MTEPVFLFDADLIAFGKALQVLYPHSVHVSGKGEAPPERAPDEALYAWYAARGAILVTGDFNMPRDRTTLAQLLRYPSLRVVWIRLIKGQAAGREAMRIIGRWHHVRATLMAEPGARGLVLAANGQLRKYRTISDTVYEVVPKRRGQPVVS